MQKELSKKEEGETKKKQLRNRLFKPTFPFLQSTSLFLSSLSPENKEEKERPVQIA
jgi:hypothetical protein